MLEELLSGLDNLPALMRKIQEQPDQVRKTNGFLASSYNVESALKPDDDSVVTKKYSKQADLLLGHLKHIKVHRELDKETKCSKSVSEAAAAALRGIEAAETNPFAAYDVCRRGEISYNDFAEITKSHLQDPLTLKETLALARELDKNRTGTIKYANIDESLSKLASVSRNDVDKSEDETKAAVADEDREIAARESAFFRALARRTESIPSDAIVSVKVIEPNLPTSSSKFDPTTLGYPRVHPGGANGKLSAKDTMTPVPEKRSRARSAPQPTFRGPMTQESLAANAHRLRITWEPDFFDVANKEEEAIVHEEHKRKHVVKEHVSVDASRSSLLTYIKEYGEPNARHDARRRRRQEEQEAEERRRAITKEFLSQKERTSRVKNNEKESEADAHHYMKTRSNSLISQLNGNMKLLETQLNRMDPSRSGYVNSSEFQEALRCCNIAMPRNEVVQLFNNYSERLGDEKSGKSLNLKQSLLNVNDFIYKQRVRASAPWFASTLSDVKAVKDLAEAGATTRKKTRKLYAGRQKHSIRVHGGDDEDLARMTDLERERRRVAMKVLRKHTDPGWANYRAKFANEVIPTGGMIEPEKLMEHLNTMGSTLGRNEFDVLVAPLPRVNGKLSLTQFEEMLHRDTFANHHGGDMGDLSIGFNMTSKRSNSQSQRNMARSNLEWDGDSVIPKTQNAAMNLAAYASEDDTHRRALRKSRINWAKVVKSVQVNRDGLEKTIRAMPELLDAPGMTPGQLGHLLESSGIRLCRDDLGLVDAHCRALRSKQQSGEADTVGGVTIKAFCDSLGMRVSQDAQNRPILLCPEHEASQDNGIFFTSHCPVVSNNTFSTSMAESGPWHMKWTTMKKHFQDRSNSRPASEFWNFEGVSTFDCLPARPGGRGDHQPWGQRWPRNDTAPRGKDADIPLKDIRPMFSPFGRGRDGESIISGSSAPRTPRSRSAPPRTRSLQEVITSTGGAKSSFNPSATYGSTTSASTFGFAPDPSAFSDEGSTNSASQRSLRSYAESVQKQARAGPLVEATQAEARMRDVTAAMSKWTSKPLADMLRDQYN